MQTLTPTAKWRTNFMEEQHHTEQTKKKKKPFFLKLLTGIFWLVLFVVLLLLAGFIFSALHKKNSLSMLPPDYSLHLHMDNAWKAVNPLVDLEAADIILSQPQFLSLRPAFMSWRTSALRQNKLVALAASRKVDAALYTENSFTDFIAVVDLSFLSLATRLLPLYKSLINVENLYYIETTLHPGVEKFFAFHVSNDMTIYIKPIQNTLVLSSNLELFERAITIDNSSGYTKDALMLIKTKTENPIHVIANASKLSSTLLTSTEDNYMLSQLLPLIKENTFSLISFGITDSRIKAEANIPLDPPENSSLSRLVTAPSKLPSLPARLSDRVQYYTLINAGSLEELKNAAFPLLPPEKKIDSLWSTGNSLCKALFNTSLEDLLFSWSGNEFAVLGMEGVDNPVFAIQVRDEKQRQKIFDRVISSIIVKSDTSLIVDGMRLPQLMLPSFLQALLGAFNINLPSAYYYVHDGYIYLSLSPEPLSALYSSSAAGSFIAMKEEWKDVQPRLTRGTSLSLFYNLAQSTPFFLRNDNVLTQILDLYTIGRTDLALGNSNLSLTLNAVSRRSGDLRSLNGFPLELLGKPSPYTIAKQTKDGPFIFWLEDQTKLSALNTVTKEKTELTLPDPCFITENTSTSDDSYCIWASTRRGEVYLINSSLQIKAGFPITLSSTPSADASAFAGGLAVPLTNSSLALVETNGKTRYVELPLFGSLKAAPGVLGENIALYDKSIMGSIFIVKNGVCINEDAPMEVSGIAFGSPALMEQKGSMLTAFITQSGELSLWRDGRMETGFPKQLEGIFFHNLVASDSYFYALSSDARLFRISPKGEVLIVQIPNASAENPFLCVIEPNKNKVSHVYVCPDGNAIYGFNEKLELLTAFPLAGWGTPSFMDTNGDKRAECFTVSMNNTLNAWNLR